MPSKNARLRRRKENRKRRDNARRREELRQADQARRETMTDDKTNQTVNVESSKNTLMDGIGRILRPANSSRSKDGLDNVHEAAMKAEAMKPNPDKDNKSGPGRGVKTAMVIAVLAMMALLVIPNFL